MLDALFGGAVVAVIGAVATFLVARRGASGRIDTSTAADLWQAADRLAGRADQLRKELRDEVVDLRGQTAALRTEGDTLRGRLAAVEEAEAACRAESATLRARLEHVMTRLEEMEGRA